MFWVASIQVSEPGKATSLFNVTDCGMIITLIASELAALPPHSLMAATLSVPLVIGFNNTLIPLPVSSPSPVYVQEYVVAPLTASMLYEYS